MSDVVFASLPMAAIAFGETLGLPRRTLLAWGRLTEAELVDPDDVVDYDALLAIWDGLAARFPDMPLGMRYGDGLDLSVAGIVGQVCANAPTLRAAMQAQLRFNHLLDPRLRIWQEENGEYHRLNFDFELTNPCIPEILEMMVTTTVRFAGLLAAMPRVGPRRVGFKHSRRHALDEYESRTQCSAEFEVGWTGIEIHSALLDAPVPFAQPDAQRYLVRHASAMLSTHPESSASLTEQVRRHIEATLPEYVPSAESVAKVLAMSERTLQRRLAAEGASLTRLVDDVRERLARSLLARPEVTAQEIAFALGYSDARAFHRAFRRWTGTSPGAFRSRWRAGSR